MLLNLPAIQLALRWFWRGCSAIRLIAVLVLRVVSLYAAIIIVLSVVIPVYGCDACLGELTRRLFAVAESLDTAMEIILVNDASPDNSWHCIQRLAAADTRIKGINLSRNFGQHFAITAGLHYTSGDWVAVMDCDLQDIPEEIPKLYRKALEGYDGAFGRRAARQDPWQKRWASWTFLRLLSWLARTPIDPAVTNFSVISGRVVADLRRMPERHRSYGMLVGLATTRLAYVDIQHAPRTHGESGYTLARKLRLAADLVISHSIRPLYMSVFAGFAFAGLGFFEILWIVIRSFSHGIAVAGWASTIASLWLIGGMLMINLGVVGLYVGKVLEQVKGRPLFLVSETLNLDGAELAPATGTFQPAEHCRRI